MSSAAGERVRRSNFVYGSTKAGLDGLLSRPWRSVAAQWRSCSGHPAGSGTHHDDDRALEVNRRQGSTLHRRQGSCRRTGSYLGGQGQGTRLGARHFPLRDDGAAAHPAADLPQVAHLDAERAGHRRPHGDRGGDRRGDIGDLADRDRPSPVARLPVVESAARADHGRPGWLASSDCSARLGLAAR